MKNTKKAFAVILTLTYLFGTTFTILGEETDSTHETTGETVVEPESQDNDSNTQFETESYSDTGFIFDFESTAGNYTSNPQVQETPTYVEPQQSQQDSHPTDTPVAVATTSGSNTGSFTLPEQGLVQNIQPKQEAPTTENETPAATAQPITETGKTEEAATQAASSTTGSTTTNTTNATANETVEPYKPRMTFDEAVTYSAVNGRGNYGTWIASKKGNIATEVYQKTVRDDIMAALNEQRTEAGLNELQRANLGAQDWAEIMCETGLYEHAALGGKYGISREYSGVGENICIAAYRSTAELLAAVASEKWNDSEGHYRTRMRDRYVYYDVAVAVADTGYCYLVERFAGAKN